MSNSWHSWGFNSKTCKFRSHFQQYPAVSLEFKISVHFKLYKSFSWSAQRKGNEGKFTLVLWAWEKSEGCILATWADEHVEWVKFNFIASVLLRDCCCHRHFVVQLSKVMSVQSLSYSEHLNCGWLLLSLNWSASLRDTMYLPGLGTALTEASRMPSWECSGGPVGIASALTFLEGGRNTGEMKQLSALCP